jgi:hypothetical protein
MIIHSTGITEGRSATRSTRRTGRPVTVASGGSSWQCALELGADRSVAAGTHEALCDAIRRGADLRIYTEFRHEDHIAPFSPNAACRSPANNGHIQEVIDFRETLLLNDNHAAAITLLRQPLESTTGFNGVQPKVACFLFNTDGHQACANSVLDSSPATGRGGARTIKPATEG